MGATREQLQDRLNAIKAQKEQLIANANACTGAIQALEAVLNDHYSDGQPMIVEATPAAVKTVEQTKLRKV
jgi:hypothetical protein